jgi:hypothetical protein
MLNIIEISNLKIKYLDVSKFDVTMEKLGI